MMTRREIRPAATACLAALLAMLFAAAQAPGQPQAGPLRLDDFDFPATVQPGQRVVGNVSLRVAAPVGGQAPARPRFELVSQVTSRTYEVPHRQLTPWEWPADALQKAGGELRVTVTMDVPEDFPPGPAVVRFGAGIGDPSGDDWQAVAFAQAGGTSLEREVRVVRPDRPALAVESIEVPLVVSRMNAPQLDGRVDVETEWQSAAAVEDLVENFGRGKPAAGTRAYVGYDDEKLYIAFVCDEPLMERAARAKLDGRDAGVWNNECVEILLNPQADRASFTHFIVDILNQRYDALGEDPWGFNPPWESATHQDERSWSVEIAIPFASLGTAAPKSGEAWHANLCRERKAQDELSAWRPTHGAFASPGRFGAWVFGSLADHLAILSAEARPPEGGWPAEVREDSQAWLEQFNAWRDRLAGSGGKLDAEQYRQLRSELGAIYADLAKLNMAAARASGKRFTVARGWAHLPFVGEPSPLDQPLAPLELTMLRDEWVDLAFNFTNHTDQPLVLRCTVRHGADTDDLDYVRLGLPGLTTTWQHAIPVAAGDGRVVYDALVPNPAGTITVAPGTTAQAWLSVHVPADAKGDSYTGRIEIHPIDMAGGEAVSVPLSVNVVPVKLTEDPAIHCFTWNFAIEEIEANRALWRAHLEDLASHGVDTCMISSLNHLPRVKAQPDGTMPDSLDFSKLDRLLDAGEGLFRLYWINMDIFEKASLREDLIGLPFGTPEYERAFKSWLTLLLAHLRERGISHDAFMINPYDESVDERCRAIARWIKEVDPKVKIVIDSSTPDLDVARKMDELTDVWVPHYRQYFPAEMQPFHELLKSSGKPRWAYWYSEGSAEKAQDPSKYYLSRFWWAYANDLDGIGYWAQQYYGDPWYREGWKKSYDTALWYPVEGGVLPSRRWQAWRQGWQDFLLLSKVEQRLREKGDKAAVAKLDDLVRQVVEFPGDPLRAEAARQWLKSQLAASAPVARN